MKKKKKPKTFSEKAKDQLKSIGRAVKAKLPGQKKKESKSQIASKIVRTMALKWKKQSQNKLNGWFDDAWNVWHLAKTKLNHIFSSSTKHARHLPRYNTTSLYTAYTDLRCYDYTKKRILYRVSKHPHLAFLNSYRRHSPFPVYLSVLKSNGPKCYRQYPNSSCGIILKSSQRNFLGQLYRFLRFWAILGLVVALAAFIYQHYTQRKPAPTPSTRPRPRPDSDRLATNKQQTSSMVRNSQSSISTTNQQNTSSINPSSPLNDQIGQQLRLWLQREHDDGFRNISEICRVAMNNTLLKQFVS